MSPHEIHPDDCDCSDCARLFHEMLKDQYREQREEEAKDLAEEERREQERGPDAYEDYERYPY